ncbi:MAG: AAA family ATPase [Patescibacteria group bacterium]
MEIIGHEKIIKLLDRSIEKENVAQAYIFSGPVGVGKYAVALDFAEKLLASAENRPQTGAIKPDLLLIKPEIEEKKRVVRVGDIKIESIRDFQHKAGLSTLGGKYKVAIIDDADRMTKEAQNALLKTLEEPNKNLVVILVVQNEKRILSTISSRCQKIKFGTVALAEMEKNIPVGIKNKEEILFWSLGRPGFMLELVKNKPELDFRRESLEELKNLFAKNFSDRFSLAGRLSMDGNLAVRKMDLWLVVIRQALLGDGGLIKISKSQSLKLIEKIDESLRLIKNTNANIKLVLENLFLNF